MIKITFNIPESIGFTVKYLLELKNAIPLGF